MSQLQLPFAATLASSGLVSVGVLLITKPSEGKVKLPDFIADSTSQDPFDVTKPEDIVDGEPVNEANFWARVSGKVTYMYHDRL
jgi:hypothetical protein